MIGFLEVTLVVLMFTTILVWAVLITFLWWELLQLKKIRQEMEELPTKLSEALKLMEDTGSFSNDLKEEIVPMIMGASSDLKIAADDMRSSIDTISKALKEAPAWVNQLVAAIDMKLESRLSKIEKVINELKGY
jgi:cell division protein FtsL